MFFLWIMNVFDWGSLEWAITVLLHVRLAMD